MRGAEFAFAKYLRVFDSFWFRKICSFARKQATMAEMLVRPLQLASVRCLFLLLSVIVACTKVL